MLERDFQASLIKELKVIFPGCIVLKNDSSYKQGIPDLSIFYKDKWAMLEVKNKKPRRKSDKERNQDYYISLTNKMSFARFIYPENKEEVLNELQRAFGLKGKTRHIQSK